MENLPVVSEPSLPSLLGFLYLLIEDLRAIDVTTTYAILPVNGGSKNHFLNACSV